MHRFARTRSLLAMVLATAVTATFATPPPSRQLDEHVIKMLDWVGNESINA